LVDGAGEVFFIIHDPPSRARQRNERGMPRCCENGI